MKKYKVLILILSSSLFIGCGGGDSKTTSDRFGSKDGLGYGTYIDSAVDGVAYSCGDSQTGVTGDTGVAGGFSYELGKPCTFSINGIILSKILGNSLKLDKVQIKVGDVDVARFLQSLDMDGNPDNNGIKISADVINVLAKNNETQLPSTSADVQRIVSLLSSAGIGYMGEAKTKAQTQKHMAGFSLNISATKVKIFEGEELGLSADITGSSEGLTYNWAGLGETSQSFKTSDLSAGVHTIVVHVTKGDMTLSDSIVIEVTSNSEFIATIKSNKTKFNTADDVVLEANATTSNGANLAYTYAWKDGSEDLGNTKTLTKKFTAGSHSVSVDVTSGGVVKTASFDFNVSDLGDFNIGNTTITQISKNLMWINAPLGSKDATGKPVCLAIHGNDYNTTRSKEDDSFTRAKTFCRNMTFAGFTNWRTPLASELTSYVKATNEANILTKYDKPCIQILALKDGATVADESDGINYRAVTTRFMTEHYPQVETGILRGHTYASNVPNDPKYNVGLRCVRSTDGSGGEDVVVVGSNIAVSITGAKTNYTDTEDVTLVSNVTGAIATFYSWKENGVEIGNSSTLVKSDFSIGHHTINLLVTADDVNKSSSVSFLVAQAPDFSDFNLTILTASNDEVIIQKSTNLMWVNEHTISKGKCAKIHGNDENHTTRYESEFTSAKTFCSSGLGNFAGFSGWRTPTASELSSFITSTQDIPRGITPLTTIAYDADCKKLLALKQMGANVDNNDSYTTILTRFSTNSGGESDLNPNIGLRCVRTHSN